jgi:putative spermidine/putrescine transport system permease protein
MTRNRNLEMLPYYALNGAVVLFLLLPIAIIFVFAVNPTPFISFPPVGFTLAWFGKFFSSGQFMGALWRSCEVASCVLVISVPIGAGAALALARADVRGGRLLTAFFMSPLMLPAILLGLALFQLYLLIGLGRPLWGLVMGHSIIAVPYIIRTTLAVLHNFDRRLEEAAAALGANPAQVFGEVTLPLIRPGVIAGGIFAFVVSFDQFPVSLFLVEPNGETLPVVLFNYIKFDLDGAIAAASMVSIAMALLVVVLLECSIGLRAYVKL